MKHIFLSLIIICSGFTLFAQSPFSVKFEQINPSGKIDMDTYFLFTLTNNTDSSYIFKEGVKYSGALIEHTYLVREIKYQSEISKSKPTQSFYFGDKRILVIKPGESIFIDMPIFNDIFGFGALPNNKERVSKVKKVRYTLTKLRYINKNNPLSGYRYVDLVSNWVDIDAAVFARLLEGAD